MIRFEIPETRGALANFLNSLEPNWNLTLLHYRNHGGQVGKVLAGVQARQRQLIALPPSQQMI